MRHEVPHTKLEIEPESLEEDCKKLLLKEGGRTDLLQAKPGICIFAQLSSNKSELARAVQALWKEVLPLIKVLRYLENFLVGVGTTFFAEEFFSWMKLEGSTESIEQGMGQN